MARCLSCNVILTAYEDSIRSSNNDELIQLCQCCLPPPDNNFGFYGNEELLDINDNIYLSDT